MAADTASLPGARVVRFSFKRVSMCFLPPLGLLLFLVLPGPAPHAATVRTDKPPAAAVASAHPLATQAGLEILQAGGNAFDAAVAVSAALAVVEPTSSGLGGGGFWLLHIADSDTDVMVDGREKAPLRAHRDMYLNAAGDVVPRLSIDGPLAAAVPGEPAALVHIADHYGRLPLDRLLAPAIRYALDGFAVGERYRHLAEFRHTVLQQSPEAAATFLSHGTVPEVGYKIRQPRLAETLTALAKSGRAGFYEGPVAQDLVRAVQSAGGIWTMKDLSGYQVVERRPITGEYHGMRITSAAPPSSGGIALLTMLNVLSGYPLDKFTKIERTHLTIESMRRAYRDRAVFLGDPDFVKIPTERLTNPWYAAGLRTTIRLDRATPNDVFATTDGMRVPEGTDTTHFSIIDRDGNCVAATLSINYPFGSGFVAAGTGVLLNDEMDDFSAKSGVPNVYGLIGDKANAIAPGKRPLSSMSPTIIMDDNKLAILGTPGGSRIITMVLLAILDYAAGGDAQSMVSQARYHHQYFPDVVQLEPQTFTDGEIEQLRAMGHHVKLLTRRYGNMQVVLWDRAHNRVTAASDPRGIGESAIQ